MWLTSQCSSLWWSPSPRDWLCDSPHDAPLFGDHHLPETDYVTPLFGDHHFSETDYVTHLMMILSLVNTISQRLIMWRIRRWFSLWWSPSPWDWSCDSSDDAPFFSSHHLPETDNVTHMTMLLLFGDHHLPETNNVTLLTMILSSDITNFWLILWFTWQCSSLQWWPTQLLETDYVTSPDNDPLFGDHFLPETDHMIQLTMLLSLLGDHHLPKTDHVTHLRMILSMVIIFSQRLIVWFSDLTILLSLVITISQRLIMWFTWRCSSLWWSPSPRDWLCDSPENAPLFGDHHLPETYYVTHLTMLLSLLITISQRLIMWLT